MLGFVDLLEWERAAAEVRAALEKSAKKIARKPTGASCERCREYNSWAEADENGVFRCWLCTRDPFR